LNIDFGLIQVNGIIVHNIPPRPARGGGSPPILSEIESPLNPGLKNYFREKITLALRTAGYDVVFDPTTSSPVPALVLDHFGPKTTDFVTMSQKIGQHLYDSQTAVNPPGLLCLVHLMLGAVSGLAILKLEREAAIRLQQTRLGGKATFNLEHLRELMLAERTRVFKVGLFIQNGNTLETIDGGVSDNQRGYHPITEVADFFLKRFLGCNLREAPEVITKRLFQATEAFIQEEIAEPDTKARYEIALLSELSSEDRTFSPRAFAERHLRLSDRQKYIERLEQSDIALQPFDKDIALVQSHLKRIQLDFESGLALLADPGAYKKHAKMRNLDDGRTHIEIEDRMKRIQGKR